MVLFFFIGWPEFYLTLRCFHCFIFIFQMVQDLKKENFDLKLRLYMEQKKNEVSITSESRGPRMKLFLAYLFLTYLGLVELVRKF